MDGVEIKAIGIRLLLKVQTGVLLIYDRYPDFADDGLSGSRIEGKYGCRSEGCSMEEKGCENCATKKTY